MIWSCAVCGTRFRKENALEPKHAGKYTVCYKCSSRFLGLRKRKIQEEDIEQLRSARP